MHIYCKYYCLLQGPPHGMMQKHTLSLTREAKATWRSETRDEEQRWARYFYFNFTF
jgi:hypothetical protein